MSPERVWSDVYGCPRALWGGLPGGHRWLVACAPRHVGQVASGLGVARFKGSIHLVVTEELTPLLTAIREIEPRGVVVVGSTLRGGPAVNTPVRSSGREDFTYIEGGDLPAWSSALRLDAPEGECAQASLCAKHGVPAVSASPADLARVLQLWWAQTPHSLVHA